MQDCPAWLKPATAILRAAASQSPSASMITGELLPSSRFTFFLAARARIPQPTSGEPVKVIMATSGWSTRRLPTTDDGPVTTLRYPGGRPHSSRSRVARAMAESGVWLAGLRTTGHPAAMAGASLWATRLRGKLNGVIAPTTPMGTRRVKASLPSPTSEASRGTISPARRRASAAENVKVLTARRASTRAVFKGLAASTAIVWANSSVRSASRRAAVSRIWARSQAGGGPASSTARAAATARSTSASPQAGTRANSAPS